MTDIRSFFTRKKKELPPRASEEELEERFLASLDYVIAWAIQYSNANNKDLDTLLLGIMNGMAALSGAIDNQRPKFHDDISKLHNRIKELTP